MQGGASLLPEGLLLPPTHSRTANDRPTLVLTRACAASREIESAAPCRRRRSSSGRRRSTHSKTRIRAHAGAPFGSGRVALPPPPPTTPSGRRRDGAGCDQGGGRRCDAAAVAALGLEMGDGGDGMDVGSGVGRADGRWRGLGRGERGRARVSVAEIVLVVRARARCGDAAAMVQGWDRAWVTELVGMGCLGGPCAFGVALIATADDVS
eukprot:364403-Chlamydomonas_euryale.AAC.15